MMEKWSIDCGFKLWSIILNTSHFKIEVQQRYLRKYFQMYGFLKICFLNDRISTQSSERESKGQPVGAYRLFQEPRD